MEEVVYILLARSKDRFSLIYVDQCTKSDDAGFFTKNPRFKCWLGQAGSEGNLYVAVHPMFGSSVQDRRFAVGKIVSKYSPHCNMEPAPGRPKEEPAPQPAPEQSRPASKPLGFVDPEKGPRHYIKRYLNEESYKNWFHRSYPGHTIFEGLGISEDEYRKIADDLSRPGPSQDSIKCACCGADMVLERELRQSNLYRCEACGISDTRLK